MRGTGLIRDCRSLCFLIVLSFSSVSAAQNLESESYFTISDRPAQTQAFSFQSVLANSLESAVDVLDRQLVDMTILKRHHADIPNADPYKRTDHFGRWINDPTDDNCYNTRGVVLDRDSQIEVTVSPDNHCKVEKGLWIDPYTRKKIRNASEIQIDHVVSLKNAYISGAFKWDARTRCLYANYMGNDFHLLSVEGHENMSKGDRSPADYLPPLKEYRCSYLKIWLKIKTIWGLNMSDYEAQGIFDTMKEYNCSASMYRMSFRELREQRKIIKDIDYVCRK